MPCTHFRDFVDHETSNVLTSDCFAFQSLIMQGIHLDCSKVIAFNEKIYYHYQLLLFPSRLATGVNNSILIVIFRGVSPFWHVFIISPSFKCPPGILVTWQRPSLCSTGKLKSKRKYFILRISYLNWCGCTRLSQYCGRGEGGRT